MSYIPVNVPGGPALLDSSGKIATPQVTGVLSSNDLNDTQDMKTEDMQHILAGMAVLGGYDLDTLKAVGAAMKGKR